MFGKGGPTLFELLRQALASTQRGYDLLAPKFDRTPFRTPDAIIEPVASAIGSVDSVVDLCCGTGAAIPFLRAANRIVGIDFSAGMLAEARDRLLGTTLETKVEFVEADVLALELEAEFDAATCFGALGHIAYADHRRFVKVVYNLLRPGGRFLFLSGDRPRVASRTNVILTAFNLTMRVRNALLKPEFVMYYLTFLLPDVLDLLRGAGFETEVRRDLFPPPFHRYCLVVATRPL